MTHTWFRPTPYTTTNGTHATHNTPTPCNCNTNHNHNTNPSY